MERTNPRRTGKRSVWGRLESHLKRDNYTEVQQAAGKRVQMET